jgi:hypothetical protein
MNKIKMKKILVLFLLMLSVSCTTNYYYVMANEDTPLYDGKNENHNTLVVVPQNTQMFINSKGTKYRRIKYGNFQGWAINPRYSASGSSTSLQSSSYGGSSSTPRGRSSYYSPSKTVNVRGYTRKNGTYVKPHSRSAPRRR